jgi:Rrf2 family protein
MLTKSGIHAVRALTILAQLNDGQYQGAAAIAQRIGAPGNYLGKLLHTLARAGLLLSQKGLGGGFRLARDAREISVYDVVESIDDVRPLFQSCIFGGTRCSDDHPCAVHHQWAGIRATYLEMLSTTTIIDLLPTADHRGVMHDPTAFLGGLSPKADKEA